MEVLLTHAKPRLVRLAPFRVGPRQERQTGRVRDEILAVLPELVDERGEFRSADLVARLNPDNEERRRWAVEKTLWRFVRMAGGEITIEPLGRGKYLTRGIL